MVADYKLAASGLGRPWQAVVPASSPSDGQVDSGRQKAKKRRY